MQRNANKEDLRDQVALVTMEIHRLQDKAQDLRDVFTELSSVYAEVRSCCFPFTYVMLRDMVHDVADTADSLQQKWYGATNSQSDDSTRKSRGSVRRLLENCRMFSANRRALSQYELILEELKSLKKKELQRVLEERQTTLAQQKVIFTQLQDLLHHLQELHEQSQQRWLCPRYLMLKRGVNGALAAFGSVVGLSSAGTGSVVGMSSTGTASARDRRNSSQQGERTKNST